MIIDQQQLTKLAGLEPNSKASLRKHLKRAGIPFRELNGQIFTTEEAITATLVGRSNSKKTEPDWNATASTRVRAPRRVPS